MCRALLNIGNLGSAERKVIIQCGSLPLVYGLMKNGNNAASELAICLSQEAEGQAFLISNGIFKQDFGANNSQQHTSQMCIKFSCLVIKRLLCML